MRRPRDSDAGVSGRLRGHHRRRRRVSRRLRRRRACGSPDGDVEDVLAYANAVAALNCRALGARGGLPTPRGSRRAAVGAAPDVTFWPPRRSNSLWLLPSPGRCRDAARHGASGRRLRAWPPAECPAVTRPADADLTGARRAWTSRGLVEACLAGRPGRVRRHRRAASPAGLSAVLPVRRQSRGRERPVAGRVPARVPRAREVSRRLVARRRGSIGSA